MYSNGKPQKPGKTPSNYSHHRQIQEKLDSAFDNLDIFDKTDNVVTFKTDKPSSYPVEDCDNNTTIPYDDQLFLQSSPIHQGSSNHFLSSWTGYPVAPTHITPLRPSIIRRPTIPSSFNTRPPPPTTSLQTPQHFSLIYPSLQTSTPSASSSATSISTGHTVTSTISTAVSTSIPASTTTTSTGSTTTTTSTGSAIGTVTGQITTAPTSSTSTISSEKSAESFPFHLEGHAKIWYDTVADSKKHHFDFLIAAFRDRFKDKQHLLDITILQTHQGRNESVLDFLSRLLKLATNRNISDDILLAVAMNGLRADLKTIVMTKEPKNIEEFRHAANLAEKAIDSNVNSVNSMNQTVLNEIHSLKEHIQSINVNSTVPDTTQHQSYQPPQNSVYVQQPVYHTPRTPYHTGIHQIDLHQCLIPVYFGGIHIKALLDTGSTISAINEKTFLKTIYASNRLLQSDIKQIVGAGGATYPVKGQIKLKFKIGGVILSQNFYIIPALRHSMILGTDFCKEKSVCLNWNTNKLSLIKDSVTINVVRVTPGFARVYRKSTIPPNTIMNVCVRLSQALPNQNYLLEPLKNSKYNFLTARCLIKNCNSKCYLQILNPTNEVIILKSGLILATLKDVDKNNIFALDDDKSTNKTSSKYINSVQTKVNQTDIQFDLSKADLTDPQKQQLKSFLNQNRNVFATNLQELGQTDVYKHKINTGNAPPVTSRPYRTSPAAKQEIQRQVEELLKNDIIEPSTSEYSSPIVLVKKKDNTWRLCIDFRALNKQSILQQHPLPRLDDVFDAIGQSNAKIYSRLDLTTAYYQMPMDEHSKHKTAFITHDNLYQFKRMPYGLNNACQSFQSLMTQVLRGLTWKHCLVYVDDVIIWSEDFESHLQHLDLIFQRLNQANLKLRPKKCDFAQSEILYLGTYHF
ncbi:Transposon Ty3-G Gag-Pol polyprotein,Transposon Ty3-I Gag-Pol polyprotein [Mytilus edulis]|uniref:Transposon Ty3-G Gag-Pol polyprotein,Transposon Ty3-I Gag-Pol polyprotein n=1 Tax=Mytilus edulis TaxID=6550 RepID=A0A8S3T6I0_MYTED|nr:Transposon Ty3-G Gag-Pol polyprotein,Transposon Ty3-I Gag-Pol polyprotein [Mytilus edulis]